MEERQPWLKKKKWLNNKIKSDANIGQYVLWGFACVWNLLSLPLLFETDSIMLKAEKDPAVLLAFLFPLVGVCLIIGAFNSTLKWRKYGATPLSLDPFPGSIGGQVGGKERTWF